MAQDLSSYSSIISNLFVRIQVDEYKASSGDTPSEEVLLFSDCSFDVDINSETYTPLGQLMSVTATSSELRVSGHEVTITLAGVPNASIAEIIYSKIKGSPVEIYRGIFDIDDPTTLISGIGDNPMLRFKGMVNNYSLNEEFNNDERSSTNTLVLTCTSDVSILENKIAGRRTNPDSMKSFYASDTSFDRVPTLKDTTFDFGKET